MQSLLMLNQVYNQVKNIITQRYDIFNVFIKGG